MEVAHGLAARGHHVTFLSTRHPDGSEFARSDGIEIHFLPGTRFGARRRGWARESASRFAELHATKPFDIIWSQSFDAFGLARDHGRSALPPLVATIHGSIAQEMRTFAANLHSRDLPLRTIPARAMGLVFSYAAVQRPLLAMATRLITVCNGVKRDLQRWFGTAVERKSCIVYNGVDISHFAPNPAARARVRATLGIRDNAPVLLSLGRLTAEKGHHLAVEALAQLCHSLRGVKLLVVGEGPHEAALRALARRMGVEHATVFLGGVDRADTVDYYNCADVFLMPTMTIEGLPFAILEAMACGTPVIATPMGGIAELVQPGCTGLLVRPGDPAALAQAIRALLEDSNLRSDIATAGRQLVQSEFSSVRMIGETIRLMEAEAAATGLQ